MSKDPVMVGYKVLQWLAMLALAVFFYSQYGLDIRMAPVLILAWVASYMRSGAVFAAVRADVVDMVECAEVFRASTNQTIERLKAEVAART